MADPPTPPKASAMTMDTTMTMTEGSTTSQNVSVTPVRDAPKDVLKPSIYQVFSPISTSKDGSNPRNPYRCIKHVLAILAKHCEGQLKILLHDNNRTTTEDICLWSDFLTEPEHAKAYVFNVQTPRQSYGK